mmetsp:Transcript_36141/g.87371  ORF Transcript_36141/g.87371 Transcript_36141/m.87371 type:complete len:360 (+) Transcript_36141:3269-4348(+)
MEGETLGFVDGASLGMELGTVDGVLLGLAVGPIDLVIVGSELGASDGGSEGTMLGGSVGTILGTLEGATEGTTLGFSEGTTLGIFVGAIDGFIDGSRVRCPEKVIVGTVLGLMVGDLVGANVGNGVVGTGSTSGFSSIVVLSTTTISVCSSPVSSLTYVNWKAPFSPFAPCGWYAISVTRYSSSSSGSGGVSVVLALDPELESETPSLSGGIGVTKALVIWIKPFGSSPISLKSSVLKITSCSNRWKNSRLVKSNNADAIKSVPSIASVSFPVSFQICSNPRCSNNLLFSSSFSGEKSGRRAMHLSHSRVVSKTVSNNGLYPSAIRSQVWFTSLASVISLESGSRHPADSTSEPMVKLL